MLPGCQESEPGAVSLEKGRDLKSRSGTGELDGIDRMQCTVPGVTDKGRSIATEEERERRKEQEDHLVLLPDHRTRYRDRRWSCREAMLAPDPRSQHHRSRPAVTNRSVPFNPEPEREAGERRRRRMKRMRKMRRMRRMKRRTSRERRRRVLGNRPDKRRFFPAGLPTRQQRHGWHLSFSFYVENNR